MGKYDPLCRYLRRQRRTEVELSFAEIERVLQAMLPNSAYHPQWWASEDGGVSHNVQRAAWRDAGFEALLIKGQERVRFRRAG
jgi:hypothetical protein